MHLRTTILSALLLAVLALPTLTQAQDKGKTDTLSYAIGANVGRNLKSQEVDVDTESFMKGFRDAFQGGELMFNADEMREAIAAFSAAQQAKRHAMAKQAGDSNAKEGQAFLAKNKKRKGITTTKTGLQYRVLAKGKGGSPKATDKVEVHYKGQLLDGTEFDSSYARGQPATFPVNQVIPGWTEVLQLMKPGSKWEVWIPSDLAYGARGAGAKIGPNATLFFQIELLKVDP